jgi:hypothetical protein
MDKKTNPFDGWTTIEEAALIIRRDKTLIRYWANRGYITSWSVGRKVRLVNLEEVRAYSQKRPERERVLS